MPVETSFPLVHVTGAVEFFVTLPAYVNASGTAVGAQTWYLGTCETQPQMTLQRLMGPVFNDKAGRLSPFQFIHGGFVGMVGCAFTRFSHPGIAALKSFTQVSAGRESRLARGSLILGNSSAVLYAKYTFYGTANATTGLPPGRKFYAALWKNEDMLESGTAVQKPLLVWECHPIYDGATGGFNMYSEDPAEFPADLIPQ